MTEAEKQMLAVLRKALWNIGTVAADEATFEEMRVHAIAALAASVLSELSLSPELFSRWQNNVISTVSRYVKCVYQQEQLPLSVPYVILKGTSAAQYYQNPEYRALGDIDIMTSHEDYQNACEQLLNHGYRETTNELDMRVNRHREFEKNGFEVEVHSFYSLRDDIAETRTMDDLIIGGLNESHVLPDMINGLTLIEHVNHHMISGLGLRQIIDWMMFVDKCLPDEKWPEFEKLATRTGHVKLAVITTRMCEMFLGLPEHAWCAQADPAVCKELMLHLLSCGNLGQKKDNDRRVSEWIFSSSSLKSILKIIKHNGMWSWKRASQNKLLVPFAFFYEACKYIWKGLTRKNAMQKLKTEYINGKRQKELFDSIGLSRERKGRVIYKNGRYVHNKH